MLEETSETNGILLVVCRVYQRTKTVRSFPERCSGTMVVASGMIESLL